MSKYEPTPEERRIIEEFEKTREARRDMPATPPSQPAKYNFPLGLDENLRPFSAHERKARRPHADDSPEDTDKNGAEN